jgi:ribosomal protein S18 acetylase RimI-like enzyme
MNLVVEQCADLQEKHGERMGKRLLNSCVFGALDTESKEMVGVATLKATLLVSENVLEGERAEVIAKNAVAALGPKQRREYKDASIGVIASELLSPDSKAIVVLSNLAVSLSARGKGIAGQICNETELLAKSWGYNEIWLLVESENEAARKLYEKIGYDVAYKKEDEIALRADVETGSFIETRADTLVLFKNLAD